MSEDVLRAVRRNLPALEAIRAAAQGWGPNVRVSSAHFAKARDVVVAIDEILKAAS